MRSKVLLDSEELSVNLIKLRSLTLHVAFGAMYSNSPIMGRNFIEVSPVTKGQLCSSGK
jgi:hypothetical protein